MTRAAARPKGQSVTADYVMYAWECSHFSAKLRGFLNHKRVSYEEKTCTLYDLLRTIPRNTGVRAMPVLRGRGGQWLVDTPEIIAQLERLHPERACIAATPRPRTSGFGEKRRPLGEEGRRKEEEEEE